MVAFNKFNATVQDLAHAEHDLATDVLKVALTNTAPIATNSILTDITQLAAVNGYTAGGQAVTTTSSAQTSGTYKLVVEDETFVATGAMGPFRYAVLYNDTAVGDPLIGFWDYGSEVTLADTETFTVDFSAANGVLQLA